MKSHRLQLLILQNQSNPKIKSSKTLTSKKRRFNQNQMKLKKP